LQPFDRDWKKFVDAQMQPGDLAAIVRTSSGAGALQRLSGDKQQLYAAIDNAHWNIGLNRAGVRLFWPSETWAMRRSRLKARSWL